MFNTKVSEKTYIVKILNNETPKHTFKWYFKTSLRNIENNNENHNLIYPYDYHKNPIIRKAEPHEIPVDKIESKKYDFEVVHCKTQEEWDFVSNKLGRNSSVKYLEHANNNCIRLDIPNSSFSKSSSIDHNFSILSFEEWCKRFNHVFPVESKELTSDDLVEGEYYQAIDTDNFIWILKHKDSYILITNKAFSEDPFITGNYKYRLATQQERDHLDQCIAAGKYVDYQEPDFWDLKTNHQILEDWLKDIRNKNLSFDYLFSKVYDLPNKISKLLQGEDLKEKTQILYDLWNPKSNTSAEIVTLDFKEGYVNMYKSTDLLPKKDVKTIDTSINKINSISVNLYQPSKTIKF